MALLIFIIIIFIVYKVANSNSNSYTFIPVSSSKLHFYSKNDVVELFGLNITNSIFYTCDSKSDKPFAINIKSSPRFDFMPLVSLGYWPNYNEINKYQQGHYIKWLADGKPHVEDIGYAYIYYYGLEYRALVEEKDVKDVLFEVVDLVKKFENLKYGYDFIAYLTLLISNFTFEEKNILLNFYQNNNSIDFYLDNKVRNSIIRILTSVEKYKAKFTPSEFLNNNEYLNFGYRKCELLSYYIDKVIEGLDESEAYNIKTTNYFYRGAMRNCEITKSVKYESIAPSTKIKRAYSYARKIISDEIKQNIKNFTSSSEPLTEIEKIIYLPEKLRKKISYSFYNLDFGENSIVSIKDIANKLGFNIQDKTTLRQSIMIVDACEIIGYAVEPNAKIDNKPYKKDSYVSLYKSQNPLTLAQKDYNIASLFMDLGYKIALEDKELLPIEIEYIRNYVQKEFELSSSERDRLKMREKLIIHNQEINSNDTIKRLIVSLDNKGKEAVSKYLISVANADGVVKTSEIKILKKIFKQLGLSEEYLETSLSDLVDNSDEVVLIKKGTVSNKKGSKIPQSVEFDEKIELKLDQKKLEEIRINTSEIQNVLQEIFTDEKEEALTIEAEEEISFDDTKSKMGSHLQSIICLIIEKENWERTELFRIVQNEGMMLNSTIDEINEWSENEYGDFLIEENGKIYTINKEVVSLMQKGGR